MTNSSIVSSFNEKASGEARPESPKANPPPPFSIRFTYEERRILRRECSDRPWSEFIRERVFGDEFSERQRGRKDMATQQAIAQALGKLGQSRLAANMNQIAKAANTGTLPVTPELTRELEEACQEVRLLREALISALGVKVHW